MARKPKNTHAARASRSADAILAAARAISAKVKQHWPAIAKFQAKRKRKLLPADFPKRFEQEIDDAAAAKAEVKHDAIIFKKATTAEEKLRDQLFEALTAARNDVELSWEEDEDLTEQFGRGRAPHRHSTPELLDFAEAVKTAFQDPATRKKAEEAGVTRSRVDAIERLRTELAAADSTQGGARGSKHGAAVSKAALFRALEKSTAHARKVALHVFKDQPKIAGELKAKSAPAARPRKNKARGAATAPSAPGKPAP